MIAMDILERNINVQIKRLDEDTIFVRSSILDLHHSMFFEMEIDFLTREVTRVNAAMIKVPYPVCQDALANIQKCVGLRLERGLAKRMADILGKNTGCTHMLEIALTGARTASYAILNILAEGRMWKDIIESDEERYEAVKGYLENSCIVFKKEV
jgi:hypothetical protein